MTPTKPKFRRIYVTAPSHDFNALRDYTDDIVFVTTGYEGLDKLGSAVKESLKDFNPATDAIIPVGKVVWVFVHGAILGSLNFDYITIGIFKDGDYSFFKIGKT